MWNLMRYEGEAFVHDFSSCLWLLGMLLSFGPTIPECVWVGFFLFYVKHNNIVHICLRFYHRPYPQGAASLEVFTRIFFAVTAIAIAINVFLLAFFMPPMRFKPLEWQFKFSLIVGHVLFAAMLIAFFAYTRLNETPADVQQKLNEEALYIEAAGLKSYNRHDPLKDCKRKPTVKDLHEFDVGLVSFGLKRRQKGDFLGQGGTGAKGAKKVS
jgi:hypothetical protein